MVTVNRGDTFERNNEKSLSLVSNPGPRVYLTPKQCMQRSKLPLKQLNVRLLFNQVTHCLLRKK